MRRSVCRQSSEFLNLLQKWPNRRLVKTPVRDCGRSLNAAGVAA
jgi:hypothetical protein